MIVFYCFTQPVKIDFTIFKREGTIYTSHYQAIDNRDEVVAEKIYFAPPSCLQNQLSLLRKSHGDTDDLVLPIDAKAVTELEEYPLDISFKDFEEQFERFKGHKQIKIAFLNAMSSGYGDHLIGMSAFDYWYKKISDYLPGTNIDITFFQINGAKTKFITDYWKDKINNTYMLPSNLAFLLMQDAIVDLGTFPLCENFDSTNMFDFYLKSFAIDPEIVPVENKRIKFDISHELKQESKELLNKFNTENRPLLLIHHTSSTPIRSMEDSRAARVVQEIIEKTDYFVISAKPLDVQNLRYKDVSEYSPDLEHFVAIISQMDAIITVDTSTLHFADAFSVPTVALFTSIEPELRCKYYPYVKGLMFEEQDGKLYGRHVESSDGFELKKELKYLAKLWDNKLNVDDLLKELKILVDKKNQANK